MHQSLNQSHHGLWGKESKDGEQETMLACFLPLSYLYAALTTKCLSSTKLVLQSSRTKRKRKTEIWVGNYEPGLRERAWMIWVKINFNLVQEMTWSNCFFFSLALVKQSQPVVVQRMTLATGWQFLNLDEGHMYSA
jgi:hypothetical protein